MTASTTRRTTISGDPAPMPQLVGRPRSRHPGLIVSTALVVFAFALGGVVLVQRAGRTVEVLVVARAVDAGHRVGASDVSTVRVAGEGFRAIPAADLTEVVGAFAAVRLVPGQLLNRELLTSRPVPAAGEATVGLSLRPGQLPADGLDAGDHVAVIAAPHAGSEVTSTPAQPEVLLGDATVYAARPGDGSSEDTIVTLIVPETRAATLAPMASAGLVGLVEVSR